MRHLLVPMLFGSVQRGEHDGKDGLYVFGHEGENVLVAPQVERSFCHLQTREDKVKMSVSLSKGRKERLEGF